MVLHPTLLRCGGPEAMLHFVAAAELWVTIGDEINTAASAGARRLTNRNGIPWLHYGGADIVLLTRHSGALRPNDLHHRKAELAQPPALGRGA